MRLSKRSEYALRALMDLASRPPGEPIPLKELAAANNLPTKFLEQIFSQLRNSGIVHSQPGARGGYLLGRPADAITLGEVIRTLDGTIAPVSCLSQIAYERCSCPDESSCMLRAAMAHVRQAIVDVVDSMTLADSVRARPGHRGPARQIQGRPAPGPG
jgi:Rrf2 family protein